MAPNIVKTPGPDHPIEITPMTERVVVRFADRIVADTKSALVMYENGYDPVHYIPLQDIDPALLQKTAHTTYCPYKGHCSYFSLAREHDHAPNALWTYEAPFPAVAAIKGYAAFYTDHVELTVG